MGLYDVTKYHIILGEGLGIHNDDHIYARI